MGLNCRRATVACRYSNPAQLAFGPLCYTLDTKFDGDAEATEEGLVFRHIVRGLEVEANHIAHVHSEGRDEKKASVGAGFHHQTIEVHGPTLSLNLWWGQLSVSPLSDEVSQDLGFDRLARRISESFSHEFH